MFVYLLNMQHPYNWTQGWGPPGSYFLYIVATNVLQIGAKQPE